MINLAICDDEAAQLALVSHAVDRYFAEKNMVSSVFTYESAEQLLLAREDYCCLDIVILDIQMGKMDGIALAKELRHYNPSLAILFITGMTEYIYESFELHAINYLLKPFNESQLFACLDKAVEQCLTQTRTLLLQSGKELIKILLSDIIRVESSGHYLTIVTNQENYRIKKGLRELELELPQELFYKVSRSDLISLDAVNKITSREISMINGDILIIPKGKHREISEAFMKHHFHGGSHT